MNILKKIRKNPELFDEGMKKRGVDIISSEILIKDEKIRGLKTKCQELRFKRNAIIKEVAAGKEKEAVIKESTRIKEEISNIEKEIEFHEKELQNVLSSLPNIPAEDVVFGKDEADNTIIKYWGEKKEFSFDPKEHTSIFAKSDSMDFESAVKVSGRRFVVLKNDLARMERALTNFMLDTHIKEFGYSEISVPLLVHDSAMYNVGQLPKFAEDSFVVDGKYRLIPTAEVPLTNLVSGKTIDASHLPMRFVSASSCFRSEAGSAGRDTHGMMRMHQFHKVELVSITHSEESAAEHERMLKAAESILQKLELHYRVSLLCSQDMGFSAQKSYDLEVWLPGEKRYREISSCSNCGDFQAMRMKSYAKNSMGEKSYLHTLNGSGLAVGRTMIAIIENYQDEKGDITIPVALRPYMDGVNKISSI